MRGTTCGRAGTHSGLPTGVCRTVPHSLYPTTAVSTRPAQGTAWLPSRLCSGSEDGVPHFGSTQPHWGNTPAPPPAPAKHKRKVTKQNPRHKQKGDCQAPARGHREGASCSTSQQHRLRREAQAPVLQLRLRAGDARALADLLPLLLLLPPLLLLPQRLLESVGTGEKLRSDSGASAWGAPCGPREATTPPKPLRPPCQSCRARRLEVGCSTR